MSVARAAAAARSAALPVPPAALVSPGAVPVAPVEVAGAARASAMPADGATPADAVAERQEELEGVPLAPYPPAPVAAKSSDALVGSPPQAVPRLTFVGAPGVASAVVQIDANVGSCAEPTPSAHAPNAPVALEMMAARTPPQSVVETGVRLPSATSDSPP